MILVTGANGFIGSKLVNRLASQYSSSSVVAVTRRLADNFPKGVISIQAENFLFTADCSSLLQGVSVIVHCAAIVHIMNDKRPLSLVEYRRINVQGTANIARQAAMAGVKRFIFLSSIKVNGEFTNFEKPFKADDEPAPQDPYAISKYEAEKMLRLIASETGMEIVIIRPPLVYGPGVKGNFQLMMNWLAHGVPLPLAVFNQNRRSLVSLDNLVDLIITTLEHPAAVNETFLVSDGEDLSTVELLKRIGVALGYPVRLFYVSPSLLKFLAVVTKKTNVYERLCRSMQVDITKTCQLLDWMPIISVDEGLRHLENGSGA